MSFSDYYKRMKWNMMINTFGYDDYFRLTINCKAHNSNVLSGQRLNQLASRRDRMKSAPKFISGQRD